MAKITGIAKLTHDAKRVYVYAYGSTAETCDGKITINKRILEDEELDFVEAIENGDIEITPSSAPGNMQNLLGHSIDDVALNLLAEIVDTYFETNAMPEILPKPVAKKVKPAAKNAKPANKKTKM